MKIFWTILALCAVGTLLVIGYRKYHPSVDVFCKDGLPAIVTEKPGKPGYDDVTMNCKKDRFAKPEISS